MRNKIHLVVNGQTRELEIETHQTLLDVIRDELGLNGTKNGCGSGDCGACTIILDGKSVNSCLILGVEVNGSEIITIEGMKEGKKLHPIQEAFVNHGAVQCGFCTPGMIMSSKALLDSRPNPTQRDARIAISGNLCRCTGYKKIIEAITSLSVNKKR
jgi:carbon-monoxide dehydrogenase small subunit